MRIHREDIDSLPPIGNPSPQYQYFLLYYDHEPFNPPFNAPGPLYKVLFTNLGFAEKINNEIFRSWCEIFDATPYNIKAARLVAAEEDFKADYTQWESAPWNLPRLTKRFFEIMNDERWYVIECQLKS